MKIGPPKFWGTQHPFFERKFRLRCLRTAAAQKQEGVLGKLKIGIITISRLPSHPLLVKFGSGAYEL